MRLLWPRLSRGPSSNIAQAIMANVVASNGEAYEYLAESVGDWPAPAVLAERLAGAGWSSVSWRQLLLGAVAMHTATR